MNKAGNIVANVILVALSVILVINTLVAVKAARDMNKVYLTEEDTFWWNISNGRYADMVDGTWQCRIYGVDTEGNTLQQCYAVADYFYAASLYRVATEEGNTEDALQYKKAMDENLMYMEDILDIAQDINQKLEIEQ